VSNEPPKATPPQGAKPAEEGRKPIPVRELRFSRPTGLEIPVPGPHGGLHSMVNSIRAGKQPGSEATFEVSYLPWLRCHRVTWRPNAKEPAKEFHVPESWATWEAAD